MQPPHAAFAAGSLYPLRIVRLAVFDVTVAACDSVAVPVPAIGVTVNAPFVELLDAFAESVALVAFCTLAIFVPAARMPAGPVTVAPTSAWLREPDPALTTNVFFPLTTVAVTLCGATSCT